MKRPIIYNYHEYRVFIKDYIKFHKNKRGISAKDVAREIKITAGFLSMIINGKRNLEEELMTNLAINFKLNKQEVSFFRSLLLLNDSNDQKERTNAYQKLSRFKQFKQSNDQELVTHKYLNKWYFVAIRELSFLKDFKEDPYWIQKRLRVKLKINEIKKALLFLKSNNMLGQNVGHLDCSEGIYKLSLSTFHKQMLQISGEAIETVPREKRQILGFTKSLSKKGQDKARSIIANALKELEQIDDENQDNESEKELYHFHLVNVPLTGGKGE